MEQTKYRATFLLEEGRLLCPIVNLQAMEPLGGSTSRQQQQSNSSSSSSRDKTIRKGPAPIASFDEVSVYSLDISSPDKGKWAKNFLYNFIVNKIVQKVLDKSHR